MHYHTKKLSENKSNFRLYIANIDKSVSKKILYELLIQTSPIKKLNYPYDVLKKSHKSYCIAEYFTEEDANYAFKVLNSVCLYKRQIKFYKMKTEKEIKLYMKGIEDDEVDEKMIYDAFNDCGNFDVRIFNNSGSKNGKYAFMIFYDYEDSDRAIKLSKKIKINNKNIKLDYAIKNNESEEKYGTHEDRRKFATKNLDIWSKLGEIYNSNH